MIAIGLQQKLESMDNKTLKQIQKYYLDNPEVKGKCIAISNLVNSLLNERIESRNKLDK